MLKKPGRLKTGGEGFQASLKSKGRGLMARAGFFRVARNPESNMKAVGKEQGYTLIELLVSIVVLAFALLSLIQLFANLSMHQVHAQYRTTATLLAQELIEEISSKRFDERLIKAGGQWSSTGVDAGESSINRTTFDDVDDYNGWSESLGAPYNGYSRTATVGYVTDDLVSAGTRASNYKRVTVRVFQSGNQYAELVTVISPVNR